MTQSKFFPAFGELPVPDQDALAHSLRLTQYVKELIHAHGGAIGFDEYMSTVLYQPGLGYYSAGSRKFGLEGDFTTAPEISALFSQCIARQCEEVLKYFEGARILELGAGTGIMAKDLLLELEKHKALPEEYWILEVSADLRQRQQDLLKKNLPDFFERIVWLDSLPHNSFTGIILANEVLDALPVKRFRKTADSFQEWKVGIREDRFHWIGVNAENELLQQLTQLEGRLPETFPEGYISEINLGLTAWLGSLENILGKGVILFVDYGYPVNEFYHPDRNEGTLLCHYRHRVHVDPFIYLGLQDITVSVDFTALAESACDFGLQVKGYTTQAYFLMASGLDALTADMTSMDLKKQTRMAQQIRVLTLPAEMGERFKVIALGKHYEHALRGFSIMDQRARL